MQITIKDLEQIQLDRHNASAMISTAKEHIDTLGDTPLSEVENFVKELHRILNKAHDKLDSQLETIQKNWEQVR